MELNATELQQFRSDQQTVSETSRTNRMTIHTFLTEADQESVRPKKTMKKKGPHRSQSLKALPGSSLKGLGKTTSFKLLTILDRSRFTVSHTGSVSVVGVDPNPLEPMVVRGAASEVKAGGGGAEGTGGTFWLVGGAGGGSADWMKGEEETGIRGGLGGRAGRTVAGPAWTLSLMRFSISSMSDWEEGWRGMVSLSELEWLCDIFPGKWGKVFARFGVWV